MIRRMVLTANLLGVSPCVAAGWSEHWTATSETASSITGNVTLRTSRIEFTGGHSLPIKKLRNVAFMDDTGLTVPATIYQVTMPAAPALLRGNRICGGMAAAVPVTFIVIWRTKPVVPGEGAGRAFAAYSTQSAPAASVNGSCGTFRYDLAR